MIYLSLVHLVLSFSILLLQVRILKLLSRFRN